MWLWQRNRDWIPPQKRFSAQEKAFPALGRKTETAVCGQDLGCLFQDEVLILEGPQHGDKHKRCGSSGSGGFQTSGRQSHSHHD